MALIWLFTAVVSLWLYPVQSSLSLLNAVGLHGALASTALYAGISIDILLGIGSLSFPSRTLWVIQAAVIAAYTLIITIALPEFWFHPFGPLLKNLAVLALLWLLYRHEGLE